MSTPNLFTNSATTQSYMAANSGMDGAQQTDGETLFQQASQSHQPEVLVKRQFEQCNQTQKSKLANEFIEAADREGISQLAATPDGQYALAVVYDHAGSDGRGTMHQVHEEQGNTAVDYTPEGGLVCTVQSVQEVERSPEEQDLDKLTKQYAANKSGKMPLPPSESLRLRNEIERVSKIVNPGQQNMWGEYTPQEKQYLEDQALKERQAANNLGMWVGGPVFAAMPVLGRVLDAPEPVVEGLGQINAEIAGGKAFGRQGRGMESVRTAINIGPAKAYVLDTKNVRVEQPGRMMQGQGIAPDRVLLNELSSRDIKYTPDNIVRIAKNADGRIYFLETGNSKAGLRHIVDGHGTDFARRGISESQIPDAVITAITRGSVVGHQGRRPIYEVEFNGQIHRIAVTSSNNGFIVGANPAR